MAWHSLRNEAEIKRILDLVIQRGTDIEVHIPGDEETYFSKLAEILPVDGGGRREGRGIGLQLALEKLSPRIGNQRVRDAAVVDIYFPFSRFHCRFHSALASGHGKPPRERLMIGYPGIVEVEEKRREERLYPDSPGFLSAVFMLGKEEDGERYELSVLNYSSHGLGLLVGEEDSSLLPRLEPGDTIPEILLFGEALLARISAVVRHKSEIHEGPHAGAFVVGLESADGLEGCLDRSPLPVTRRTDCGERS
jgi:hypothetical protein